MYAFTVKTMTCGGCSAAITRAILATDKSATVNATPATRRVEVKTSLSQRDLLELFDDAGFPAEPA